jgi:hypothetical protein
MNTKSEKLECSQYINRWLISEILEDTISGNLVSIETDINVWKGFSGVETHENPLRTSFLEKRKRQTIPKPEFIKAEPQGAVLFQGQEKVLQAHFPFGNPTVALSGFWPSPTWIRSVAYTILTAKESVTIPCELAVCGGFSLWVNGNPCISFTPFIRNTEEKKVFNLPLLQGDNQLIAYWDDLAERDSQCSFSIKTIQLQKDLYQSIPLGRRKVQEIRAVETAVGSLAFKQDHFMEGDILLTCLNPYTEKPFSLTLEGATEENFMVGELEKIQVTFLPGENTASLGNCNDYPFGFLQFRTEAKVEGMNIRNALTMENFPLSLLPEKSSDLKERKTQAFEFLTRHGEQNANRAVALLHTKGNLQEIEKILKRQISFINRRCDCSDFYLPYFPHILRDFSETKQISESLLEAMKQCILHFRYWHDEPGNDVMWFYSENHALMFHVCQLICGELYPEEIFTNSGMTGKQMQEKAILLLREWFKTMFAQGFTEWNSPAYLPINTLGFASLYAQTKNEEMKGLAKKGLDFIFHLLSVYSFDGVFCTTAGRTYPKELLANNANCPSFISYIGYGYGNVSHAGKGVISLCFSDYEPPEKLEVYYQIPEGKGFLCQSTQGFDGYVDIYLYKTAWFSMSSANDFHVGKKGMQENPFHLLFSATEQIWINHPGELAEFGHARPSYWAGNGILPRVNQYRGFASIIFSIPESHPVDFTHIYFPTMEFFCWEQKGKWLFAKTRKGAFLAIYNSNSMELKTFGPNTNREYISKGRTSIYLIRVSEPDEFSSYESFTNAMEQNVRIQIENLGFEVDDPLLGTLQGGWSHSLRHNGKLLQYSGFSPEGTLTWVIPDKQKAKNAIVN